MLGGRERPVTGKELIGDIPEQDHSDFSVEAGRHHGMVDDARQPRQQTALPQPDVPAARIRGRPQQPVVAGILVLEHVAVPADDNALEPGPRLGVLRHPRLATAGRQQFVQRGYGLILGHLPPPPSRPKAPPATVPHTTPDHG